jgi:hypothetical protein
MRESDIERRLRLAVEDLGGECWKFVSPGNNGVPDRLCLLPGGRIIFVEVKRPGEKPRPQQLKRIRELVELGQQATWIDSVESIAEVLR